MFGGWPRTAVVEQEGNKRFDRDYADKTVLIAKPLIYETAKVLQATPVFGTCPFRGWG